MMLANDVAVAVHHPLCIHVEIGFEATARLQTEAAGYYPAQAWAAVHGIAAASPCVLPCEDWV